MMLLFSNAVAFSRKQKFQFVLPEALLHCMLEDVDVLQSMQYYGFEPHSLDDFLCDYLKTVEKVPSQKNLMPEPSHDMQILLHNAITIAREMNGMPIMFCHFMEAMIHLEGCVAGRFMLNIAPWKKWEEYFLKYAYVEVLSKKQIADYKKYGCGRLKLIGDRRLDDDDSIETDDNDMAVPEVPNGVDCVDDMDDDVEEDEEEPYDEETVEMMRRERYSSALRRIDNDPLYANGSFTGRQDEVERALTTLCKRNKCNVVFVGDHGVGKTTMLTGLIKAAARYPKTSRVGNAQFYKINIASLVLGASYADEVENHISNIVNDIKDSGGSLAILFADNMSELMPQSPNDATPDTLRLLTSLIDGTGIRIVTTASFEQYKRLSQHNVAVAKNFCRIDINEPPLNPDGRSMVQLAAKELYAYHNVKCDEKMLGHIIDTAVANFGKDVAMPGRAIDLVDSLAAYAGLRKNGRKRSAARAIDADLLAQFLKTMGLGSIASEESNAERLRELEPAMLSQIFGQDEAVHGVAESVLLAKAGLSDDTKPLAAYLFVGPTGVGKTELAKVLAKQLGVKLIRFDMSEYAEQHTVSRLVGSPAGYIGYEDGGLLTDAVRKNPNCVLLFDEIEKAHSAVFNILLQVLDYAQLTDNKGYKADFSGTIIIMTSNAGARFATGTGLGFGTRSEKSEIMGSELKKTFAPEFLNRLTQIVSFHDMSMPMAERILDRKIGELKQMLKKRKDVDFEVSGDARTLLLNTGFSSRYGAREMDRAIGHLLKPVLMNALLFDNVQSGCVMMIDRDGDLLKVAGKK